MGMKRFLCRKAGRASVVPMGRFWSLVSLVLFGCGSGTVGTSDGGRDRGECRPPPPSETPAVANDRFDQVQVSIDGQPIEPGTTIAVNHDFVVTVSFRRRVVWPGMNNPESQIDALIMERSREHMFTRRFESLEDFAEKAGVLTFSGKVDGLPDTGVFGLWIRESVRPDPSKKIQRYHLFTANVRVAK